MGFGAIADCGGLIGVPGAIADCRGPIAVPGAIADGGLRALQSALPAPTRDGTISVSACQCSSVAQWQSIRLLTGGLLVRVQPEEPIPPQEGHPIKSATCKDEPVLSALAIDSRVAPERTKIVA